MTEAQMKRAIGVLVDSLTDVAFGCGELTGADAQDLLQKAGLTVVREATPEDCAQSEFDIEPGDEWHALTPFALDCRKLAP